MHPCVCRVWCGVVRTCVGALCIGPGPRAWQVHHPCARALGSHAPSSPSRPRRCFQNSGFLSFCGSSRFAAMQLLPKLGEGSLFCKSLKAFPIFLLKPMAFPVLLLALPTSCGPDGPVVRTLRGDHLPFTSSTCRPPSGEPGTTLHTLTPPSTSHQPAQPDKTHRGDHVAADLKRLPPAQRRSGCVAAHRRGDARPQHVCQRGACVVGVAQRLAEGENMGGGRRGR
jgi:hypothetical protein